MAATEMSVEEETKTNAVILVSSDGDKFQLPLRATKFSKLIETMVGYEEKGEDSDSDESDVEEKEIPLVEIKSKTLLKCIEFAKHYMHQAMPKIPQVRLRLGSFAFAPPPFFFFISF